MGSHLQISLRLKYFWSVAVVFLTKCVYSVSTSLTGTLPVFVFFLLACFRLSVFRCVPVCLSVTVGCRSLPRCACFVGTCVCLPVSDCVSMFAYVFVGRSFCNCGMSVSFYVAITVCLFCCCLPVSDCLLV